MLSETAYEESCTFETVCNAEVSDTNLISYRINQTDEFYIDNWIEQVNMQCTPKAAVGIIGAMAFLGAAIGCFFLPVMGDIYGRYNVFMAVSFL